MVNINNSPAVSIAKFGAAQKASELKRQAQDTSMGAAVRFGIDKKAAAESGDDDKAMGLFFKTHFNASQAVKTSEVIPVSKLFMQVQDDPTALFSPHQRLYRAIMSYGVGEPKVLPGGKREVRTFKMFTEASDVAPNPLRGVEEPVESIINHLESGLDGNEKGRRVLLLLGGAGSGKTESLNILKRGFEKWSKHTGNPVYALKWENLPQDILKLANDEGKEDMDPKLSNPLLLFPLEVRQKLQDELNTKFRAQLGFPVLSLTHDELSGRSARIRDLLVDREKKAILETKGGADLSDEELLTQATLQVVQKYARAQRVVVKEGHGIGYLDAKDPQYFDTTTLTGDVNPAGEARYGSAEDARAFDYGRGKIFQAQGGLFHFDEMLKTKDAHLTSFLQLGQEGRIQGISGVREKVNTVMMATTNLPEYIAMRKKPTNKAFFERINVVKFRYTRNKNEELQVYKESHAERLKNKGIVVAPHAMETAALFAVMTRLQVPEGEDKKILPVKADLYAGEFQKYGNKYTQDKVQLWRSQGETNMQDESKEEGFVGIGTRQMKDFLANVEFSPFLGAGKTTEKTLDGFAMIKSLRDELETNSLFKLTNAKEREEYEQILNLAQERLNERVAEDVKDVIESDEDGVQAMFSNYIARVQKWNEYDQKGITYDNINEQGLRETLEQAEKEMIKIEEKLGKSTKEARESYRYKLAARYNQPPGSKPQTLDDNPELKKIIKELMVSNAQSRIPIAALKASSPNEKELSQQSVFYERMQKKGYNRVSAINALECFQKVYNRS